jgi:hypothetical protein
MSGSILPNGPRRATTALWCTGAALAVGTGAVSVVRGSLGFGVLYGAVAVALLLIALETHRGRRVAEIVSIALLGSQMIGAVGAGWELHHPDYRSAKARHLHELGIDYRSAIAGNLVFSLVASAVFVWAVTAIRRRAPACHRDAAPRSGPPPGTSP